MSSWNSKELGKIASIYNGSTPSTNNEEYWNGDVIWITPKDLSSQNQKYIFKGERNITRKALSNSNLLPKGTILLSSRAPIGLLSIASSELVTNQGFKNIVVNAEMLHNEFLFYYLKLKRNELNNLGSGTTFKELSKSTLEKFKINLPPLPTQRTIAKVLSDLDAKIELNNKINAELEAMAKTLYDYWFVQFDFPDANGKPYKSSGGKMVYNKELKREIPEGWEVKSIEKFGEFKNGINYDPKIEGDVNAKIINVRNISGSNIIVSKYDLDTIRLENNKVQKYLVTKSDILIARSGIPGATRIMFDYDENTIYCGFIIRFQVKIPKHKLYLFYCLKDLEKIMTSKSGGTIMPNVNQDSLKRMNIIKPSNHEIEKFNNLINPIFKQINSIINENQELSSLRDWLLPMLMNGQVKVK